MYPLTIPVLCIAFAGFTGISAQMTTISLYIPGADTQPLVGSIVASDATATTYVLECAPGTDASDCGFDGPFTLTEGPSTAVYTLSADAFTGYEDCSLAGTESAVCIESNGGSSANFPGMSTETYSATDFTYMPVTITAGAVAGPVASASVFSTSSGVVSTSSSGSSSTGSSTNKSSTIAATGTTPKSSGTSASTSAGAATQTTSSKASTSTAGMPAVTGNARWAIGGAAAVLALMA